MRLSQKRRIRDSYTRAAIKAEIKQNGLVERMLTCPCDPETRRILVEFMNGGPVAPGVSWEEFENSFGINEIKRGLRR
jgi:hypothetical protein